MNVPLLQFRQGSARWLAEECFSSSWANWEHYSLFWHSKVFCQSGISHAASEQSLLVPCYREDLLEDDLVKGVLKPLLFRLCILQMCFFFGFFWWHVGAKRKATNSKREQAKANVSKKKQRSEPLHIILRQDHAESNTKSKREQAKANVSKKKQL